MYFKYKTFYFVFFHKINWDKRHQDHRNTSVNVSIDGIDFEICEPSPFNRKWYSFKHNGAGLRYEIGLSIDLGEIVWAYGGVPCGEYSDLRLAREVFVYELDLNEKAIADRGYKDGNFFITPDNSPSYPKIKRILARHETINRRLKQWKCLSTKFRHPLFHHPKCFHAIICITQIIVQNGEPIFKI